ncbi:MAG: serine/threonine protein phosphatase [Akkermansiaceae bacterium]|nr:serine/threonine protein phosphatase [Akkermansiaceae bacterium]
MRIIAVGDIHGCRASLEALADYAEFSPDDTIVTVGDYVDRGPDTKGVIDLLLAWQRQRRMVCLMGNHEIMMLEARESREALLFWMAEGVGGEETLQSYGAETLDDIPEAHWEFIASGLPYYETDGHIVVHAGLRAPLPLDRQLPQALFWQRLEQARPHCSGKTVICGHTSQKNGLPVNLGHTVCIDTWACGDGWLTALDLATGTYWQTNERGDRRMGDIAEL